MKLNILGKAKRCFRMKKVLRFIGNVLIVLVLIMAIVMTIAVVTSSRGERVHLPNLFGYAILSVQSDSMESEKGFYTGDLIVIHVLSEEEANNLKVGDVITFIRIYGNQQYLETHRIVSCEGDDFIPPNEIVDGVWMRGDTRYYTTRGDNTPGVDMIPETENVEYTSYLNIYGIWTGTHIPKLGYIMDFLQSSIGFMICVVLPVALFFIYQLYVFIMTLSRKQKEKALEEVSGKEEELKKKAIEEYLAQQQAAGGSTPAPDSDTKPAKEETPAEPAEKTPAKEDKPAAKEPADEKPADDKPEDADKSAPADETPNVSEEEKERIIREYLAKQAQEKKSEE